MLFVVCGPPGAGKSSWVAGRAKPGDVTVDFDALAATLTPGVSAHVFPDHVRKVAQAARRAAVDAAVEVSDMVDVFVIHALPGVKVLRWYRSKGAEVVTVDPGRDVVLRRCRDERSAEALAAAEKWYDDRSSGDGVMPPLAAAGSYGAPMASALQAVGWAKPRW